MSRAFHAEQATIGAVLIDPSILATVRVAVPRPDDFSHAHHGKIWRAVLDLAASNTPIDIVTVAEALRDRSDLAEIGGAGYLSDLATNTPTAANAAAYAAIVAQEAQRRRVGALLTDALEELQDDDPAVVVGELQAALSQSGEHSSADSLSTLDLIDLGFEALRGNTRELLATGLGELDDVLGGLEPGRLYVIAARTGCGKSALMLSMLHHLAKCGHPVGLLELEMPAAEVFNRLAACRYGLNLSALTWKHENALRDLDAAYQLDPMSSLQVFVDDASCDLPALLARTLDWHHRHGIRALFLDYVGLVQVRGGAPRHEKIGECSRALKRLAKRLAIPVVIGCQLNRDSDKDDRQPRLFDLRDSGSVEQDADAVIAINPKSNVDAKGRRNVEIGVLKNRSGRTGWLSHPIVFDGRTQRFFAAA